MHQHSWHTVCAGVSGVSGVTKYARTARCAVVSSQLTGGAVSEGEVVFSVLFLCKLANCKLQTANCKKIVDYFLFIW